MQPQAQHLWRKFKEQGSSDENGSSQSIIISDQHDGWVLVLYWGQRPFVHMPAIGNMCWQLLLRTIGRGFFQPETEPGHLLMATVCSITLPQNTLQATPAAVKIGVMYP